MRTLEDLGISPAPWKVEDKGVFVIDSVNDANGKVITGVIDTPNARLIAAAPDLYKALREAVIEMCHDCPSCDGSENGYRCDDPAGRCFVQKWREVLEKAAGEEAK